METGRLSLVAVQRDGSRLREIPLSAGPTIAEELNQPGRATFTVPTSDARVGELTLVAEELQFWNGSTLAWWGVPLLRRWSHDVTTLDAVGLGWYLGRRFIRTDRRYAAQEQLTIAADLVAKAQGVPNTDLQLDFATVAPSGVTRTVDWWADERRSYGQALQELVALDDGFDLSVEVFGDGRREVTPHYPQQGSATPVAVAEWGRTIVGFTLPDDATCLANDVDVLGAGTGPSRAIGTHKDATSVATYGNLVDVVAGPSNIGRTDWLNALARDVVDHRKDTTGNLEAQVRDNPSGIVDAVGLGDVVTVRIAIGGLAVDGPYRLTRRTRNYADDTAAWTLEPQ